MSYSAETIAHAASRGVDVGELPLIVDGCSGGMTWLYAIGGRHVSCEDCCNRHDIDYQFGGSREERRASDKRLRECAARAGKPVPGWLERMRDSKPRRAWIFIWVPPLRRLWRWIRAWVMWVSVRAVGWKWWG